MINKLVSLFLTIIMCASPMLNSCAEGPDLDVSTEVFVRQQLFRQYDLIYDTFNAAITFEDGSEVRGIGFTDYSAYYEAEDGTAGFFPAGFIADPEFEISWGETEKGLIIENLDFTDEKHQFVFAYETESFMEHCVRNGQYLKYGVNEKGSITYETSEYKRGVCDESLGALYSYDTGKFLFDPDVGSFVGIKGVTLFEQIDFAEIEALVNQIIEKQDTNYSHQEIVSSVYLAHEAIISYLLSMQEESFLGYKVSDLVKAASQLDPMQCIRITPEGFVIIDIIDKTPATADELTKWLVGSGCMILIAGSIGLDFFVPAAVPLSATIMGAAIDAFMQVVVESKSLENVQWGKVAIAAASGAIMGWICPMAASSVTTALIQKEASEALAEMAGYGVLTLSTSVVAGATNTAFSLIDQKTDGWNTFLIGAAIGATSTVFASAMAEVLAALGPKVAQIVSRTRMGQWLRNVADKVDSFIQNHQVHIFNEKIEAILTPKSVHMAAKSAMEEMNKETGILGGRYSDLTTSGDHTIERHELPSCAAYNKAKGIEPQKRADLPAIKMSPEDHRLTASWGPSRDAIQYQSEQYELINKGNMTAAIKMDIDDLHSLFGDKYNEGIRQALRYAVKEGWWNPWKENTGILSQLLESVNLTLEEITLWSEKN